MADSTNNNTDPNIDITSPYTPRRPSPIISLSINHPIGSALRKIKNFLTHKQTLFATTFSIKVTPIVALVSVLGIVAVFGGGITTAYNFGKSVGQKVLLASLSTTPTPTPKAVITTVSLAGIIKATYQNPITPTVEIATDSSSPRNDTGTPTPQPIIHYILVGKSGSITYLSSRVTLQTYLNQRVLITGSLNSTTNTLTISKSSDIEVLQ